MEHVNSDIAYEYIRKRILAGEYAAGRNLATNALSLEIGVSRTPVRDALRQLEADGLVTIQARLGASVKAMDSKEFREVCEMRLALESHAAGLAAVNRTTVDLDEMERAVEAMRRLTQELMHAQEEEPLLSEIRREDVRFHIAIIGAAKNDLMKKEILRLHLINRVVASPLPGSSDPVVDRKERDKRRGEALASHEAIFTSLRRSDPLGAKTAMALHIQDIIDHTLRAMTRMSGGLLARPLTEDELSYTT